MKQGTKKFLSMFLALTMLLGLMPTMAYAAGSKVVVAKDATGYSVTIDPSTAYQSSTTDDEFTVTIDGTTPISTVEIQNSVTGKVNVTATFEENATVISNATNKEVVLASNAADNAAVFSMTPTAADATATFTMKKDKEEKAATYVDVLKNATVSSTLLGKIYFFAGLDVQYEPNENGTVTADDVTVNKLYVAADTNYTVMENGNTVTKTVTDATTAAEYLSTVDNYDSLEKDEITSGYNISTDASGNVIVSYGGEEVKVDAFTNPSPDPDADYVPSTGNGKGDAVTDGGDASAFAGIAAWRTPYTNTSKTPASVTGIDEDDLETWTRNQGWNPVSVNYTAKYNPYNAFTSDVMVSGDYNDKTFNEYTRELGAGEGLVYSGKNYTTWNTNTTNILEDDADYRVTDYEKNAEVGGILHEAGFYTIQARVLAWQWRSYKVDDCPNHEYHWYRAWGYFYYTIPIEVTQVLAGTDTNPDTGVLEGINQAVDNVNSDTKLENHTFTRYVQGLNGETVYGIYTFAAGTSYSTSTSLFSKGETWGNSEGLEVNSSIQQRKNIKWEFNVYDNQDSNNYLCQYDGAVRSTEANGQFNEFGANHAWTTNTTGQNTYYSGDNGVLNWQDGTTSTDNVETPVLTIDAQTSWKYEVHQKFASVSKDGADAASTATDTTIFAKTNGSTNGWTFEEVNKVYANPNNKVSAVATFVQGVYGEDMTISVELNPGNNASVGFGVAKDDRVDSANMIRLPGAKAEDFFTVASGGDAAKLGEKTQKTYKGEQWTLTLTPVNKAGANISGVSPISIDAYSTAKVENGGNSDGKLEFTTDAINAPEFYHPDATQYRLNIKYIGLWYDTNNSEEERANGWMDTETFQWVTTDVNYMMDVEQREVALKKLDNIDKVFDGSNLVVKQELDSKKANGDIAEAIAEYQIRTDADTTSDHQMDLESQNVFWNWIRPAQHTLTGSYYDMDVVIYAAYADYNAGLGKAVTVYDAELRDAYIGTEAVYRNFKLVDDDSFRELSTGYENVSDEMGNKITEIPVAAAKGNGVIEAAMTGNIYVAGMHVKHDNSGSFTTNNDTIGAREALSLSVRGMKLTTDGKTAINGNVNMDAAALRAVFAKDSGYKNAELPLVVADDNFSSYYDYDDHFVLLWDQNSNQYIEHGNGYIPGTNNQTSAVKGLAINAETGKIEKMADQSTSGDDSASMPTIRLILENYPNFFAIEENAEHTYWDGSRYQCLTNNMKDWTALTDKATTFPNTKVYDSSPKVTAYDNDSPNYTGGNGKRTQGVGNDRLSIPAAFDKAKTYGGGEAPQEITLHNIKYRITGDNNNYRVYLPETQLNDGIYNSTFVKHNCDKAPEGTTAESYLNLKLYQNGDGKEFTITAPQDSYLKDVYVVAVPSSVYKYVSETAPFLSYDDVRTALGQNFDKGLTAAEGEKYVLWGSHNGQFDGNDELQASGLKMTLDSVLTAPPAAPDYTETAANTFAGSGYGVLQKVPAANTQVGGSTFKFRLETVLNRATGENFVLVVVPEFGTFDDNLVEHGSRTQFLPVTGEALRVEYDLSFDISGKEDCYGGTCSGEANPYHTWGTVALSYDYYDENGVKHSAVPIVKDQDESKREYVSVPAELTFNVNEYNTFFEPAKLLPGTEVTATIKVWRNGVTNEMQEELINGVNDPDAFDIVTLKKVLTVDDYMKLFPDHAGWLVAVTVGEGGKVNIGGRDIVGAAGGHTESVYLPLTTTQVSYTAAADTGYAVDKVTVENQTAAVNGSIDLDMNDRIREMTVTFKAASTNPSGPIGPIGGGGGGGGGGGDAKVNVRVDSGIIGGKVTTSVTYANEGKDVIITVTPDVGKVLGHVTVIDENGKGYNVPLTDKGNGTYVFEMPASAVKVFASFKDDPNAAKPGTGDQKEFRFVDVADKDWFNKAVYFAAEKGLMSGIGDDKFGPNLPTTRGMIVTILHRMEGTPAAKSAVSFDDVKANEYYAKAIAWAVGEGVASGYGNGDFGPDDQITREQLARILYNYAELKGYDVTARDDLSAFKDAAAVSPWALNAVQWAVAEGLISGKGDGELAPGAKATRAEVATILMNFYKEIVE